MKVGSQKFGLSTNVSELSKDIDIGIEVKYRATLNDRELNKSREIAEALGCEAFVVVCKNRPDETLEKRLQKKSKIPLAVVPLADFLMLF